MENYTIILSQFKDIGYNQTSTLTEYELCKALDKIYQTNSQNGEIFNRDVAQEIFQQTTKNDEHEVILKDYINTILEAHILLKKYIHQHLDKIKGETDIRTKEELTQQLEQYRDDYDLLTTPFSIDNRLKTDALPPESRVSQSSNISDFFSQSPKVSNQSQSLKITFIIALACFLLEFFLMFEKHHFLSMLAYVAVLSIFLLNYFDKTYIRVTLYMLLISVFLDFLWILLQADNYWNVSGASQHSNSQTGFLRFIYIMTLLTMLGKAAITYLLFKYRSNTAETRKTVRVLKLRFELSADVPSPLSIFVLKSL